MKSRREWLRAAVVAPVCLVLPAAPREFWESKDPANWSSAEKEVLLNRSPWAVDGFARMELEKKRPEPAPGSGRDMPDMRPGSGPGGVRSVPIGAAPPRAPNPDPGQPVQFPVMARWETAKPVRLAGGPEVPELTGRFYVIRVRGLPLMPPAKAAPGEAATANPNEAMLQAIREGSRLERRNKPAIRCVHLFTGSGGAATEVLLFFPRGADPITAADKIVTLESWFAPFHLSVKFSLKEMMYRGELAL